MKKDPRIYLAQILERIERIFSFTAEGKDSFFESAMTQDAVIRNLEVIGEAAKRVPDDYRKSHPSIPWRTIAGLRDVLIHQYEGVGLDQVWKVVEKDLPILKNSIQAILPPLDELKHDLAGKSE
jgi:uncharacterized protein with HEPN domain